MTKITFQDACNKTVNWLMNKGVDATQISYTQFNDYVTQFCKEHGYEIN